MKHPAAGRSLQFRRQTQRAPHAEVDAPASVANGVDVRAQLSQNAAFKARMLQRKAEGAARTQAVHAAAAQGVQGSGGPLPYLDLIQRSFGRHDVTRVQAYVGGAAKDASEAIGAQAYATGDCVAFGESPSLHTAAHEAAHVVQQRRGVSLTGGVGAAGDAYEQHADRVADAVVRGESAEGLLDTHAGGPESTAIQRREGPHSSENSSCTGQEQRADLDGQRCLEREPLDTSDPTQPADVSKIITNVAMVKREMERLRDDVVEAILIHGEAAAQVGLAYATAWSRCDRVARTADKGDLTGIAVNILSHYTPALAGWFLGVLFGASAGGETRGSVSSLAGILKSWFGRRLIQWKKTPGFAQPTGPVDPTVYIAQINARAASLSRREMGTVMSWLRSIRPVEDEPAAWPWLGTEDPQVLISEIHTWRENSLLMRAPEPIDLEALTTAFERCLWGRWMIRNYEYEFTDTHGTAQRGSITADKLVTVEMPPDAVLGRLRAVGLVDAKLARDLDRPFTKRARQILRQACKNAGWPPNVPGAGAQ